MARKAHLWVRLLMSWRGFWMSWHLLAESAGCIDTHRSGSSREEELADGRGETGENGEDVRLRRAVEKFFARSLLGH